jgi:hypothetical protein
MYLVLWHVCYGSELFAQQKVTTIADLNKYGMSGDQIEHSAVVCLAEQQK